MVFKSIRFGLLLAALAMVSVRAQATTVSINYAGLNGYTATGSFTYNGATAPSVITEANGAVATNVVQSFNISFFNPANMLIETGSSVINGVSSDRFFRLTYNTVSNVITALDADVGGTYQYFLSNLRTPTGSVVAPGATGFNFFNRATANAALDTAASISTAVPEPSGLLLLPLALIGILALRHRRA